MPRFAILSDNECNFFQPHRTSFFHQDFLRWAKLPVNNASFKLNSKCECFQNPFTYAAKFKIDVAFNIIYTRKCWLAWRHVIIKNASSGKSGGYAITCELLIMKPCFILLKFTFFNRVDTLYPNDPVGSCSNPRISFHICLK